MVSRLMILLCVGLLACGASARTKALRVNLVALNVARDSTLSLSKEREAQIVEKATSKEEGRAQLDEWRTKIDKVIAAIDIGYRAVHDAALLDDAKSASEAAAAAQKALALVKEVQDLFKDKGKK